MPDMSEANADVDVDVDVDVLIVGGGPVGLTARVLLERWGVRTSLVEKRTELSPFPRSRLVNVRSMEIFRGLGLAVSVAAVAFPPKYGRIRFRDTLSGDDFASAAIVGVRAPVPESPVTGAVTSQDRLEPLLLDAVDAADAPVRFGVELVGLTEDADAVVAVLLDHRSGAETRVRARYVLAADGAHSTVRRHLGIATTGPGELARVTTVVFDADLSALAARQPAGVYFTAHGTFLPLYPEGGWSWLAPTPEDAGDTDWSALVAHAIGTDVDADVLRVQHWTMNAAVAERFRHGRTLLAGDAAHALPIMGGLGMNAGLADVHNLCWKLAGVLRGWAGPGLLDSYEAERLPVAHRTLRQAVANTKLGFEVQDRRRAQIRSGAGVRERVELPWSERYFAQLGLVLGVRYDSGAVLADGGTLPEPSYGDGGDEGTDYLPSATPGCRMPHLWLAPGRSTLDACGEWFTVLTPDPARWEPGTGGPWPVRVEPLPGEHADACGLGPHGALLVRPDGHVAARWPAGPPTGATLPEALAAVTGPAA
ncbi:2-polyprenyl-6-methoxyphenol hydroxylase [Streptomyces alboflavus]|uniref:2-polyprenyl-6-methoxyphenol hydroxylase n=2 Tax=Streptomyces alboflavus TaxID=67267 RepID=A0A1Z1WJG0_9ACTN|nr:FAD-dependent monooxygenase [Streptomyces alboflavus]ARX86566.1 2-polyprenyl-6-methoxyphenol hydroxylase [Streptomyces alboflavus]